MNKKQKLKQALYTIIFESDTKLGFLFDIVLIFHILLSVTIMMLDSMQNLHNQYLVFFDYIEWYITIIFMVEYLLRIYCSPKKTKYVFSFYGLVDFLSLIPSFLSLVVGNTQYLVVIRLLRVLRIFRILRLVHFLSESAQLLYALKMSVRKIIVFFFAELILTVVFGSIMYVIEGEANGFTSIPRSIYWAIVTMTTVGYGDISPQTNLGQTIASLAMIIAYSIIIISTGMITMNLGKQISNASAMCPHCKQTIYPYPNKIKHCPECGNKL